MADAFTPVNGIIRRVLAIDEVSSGIFCKVPKIPVPVNGVIREGYTAFDPYIVKNATATMNTIFGPIPKTRIQEALDNGCTIMKLQAYKAAEGNSPYFTLRKVNSLSPTYPFVGENTSYQYIGNIEHTVSITELDGDVTEWEIRDQSTTFTNVNIYFE